MLDVFVLILGLGAGFAARPVYRDRDTFLSALGGLVITGFMLTLNPSISSWATPLASLAIGLIGGLSVGYLRAFIRKEPISGEPLLPRDRSIYLLTGIVVGLLVFVIYPVVRFEIKSHIHHVATSAQVAYAQERCQAINATLQSAYVTSEPKWLSDKPEDTTSWLNIQCSPHARGALGFTVSTPHTTTNR